MSGLETQKLEDPRMLRLTAVALALTGLSFMQEKGPKKGPDWVEITPERVEKKKAKRVMKLEDRLVFEIGFTREASPVDRVEQVAAHCLITNPTKKSLNASLKVAVYDKDKRLISTSAFNWGGSDSFPAIKPGEKQDGTSIVIDAPPEELDRIKYAQARLYVKE